MVQFRVSPELKDQLDEAAETEGVDRSTWLRTVVTAALERWSPPRPVVVTDTDEPNPERTRSNNLPTRACLHPIRRRMGNRCQLCGVELRVTYPRGHM